MINHISIGVNNPEKVADPRSFADNRPPAFAIRCKSAAKFR